MSGSHGGLQAHYLAIAMGTGEEYNNDKGLRPKTALLRVSLTVEL